MFTSDTPEWETPQSFFDDLNSEFGFTVDVCATPDKAKVAKFFDPQADGLSKKWDGVCWMNPPYGRGIGRWTAKAKESAEAGATVVCLLPARTDTAWWHDHCIMQEVRFVRGRLKFSGCKNSAPFPSAVVIFRPK